MTATILPTALACAALTVIAGTGAAQTASAPAKPAYAYATNGVLDELKSRPGGAKWKLLLDASNLGGKELEAAEVTLPAGTATPSHTHGAVEVIYVLSGLYEHEVNGKRYRLTPGMIGIVRPGDKVRHLAPTAAGAKLLVLWAPAGEAARAFAHSKGVTPPAVPEVRP